MLLAFRGRSRPTVSNTAGLTPIQTISSQKKNIGSVM